MIVQPGVLFKYPRLPGRAVPLSGQLPSDEVEVALVDVPVVGTASYEWPVALVVALATGYPIHGAGLWLPLYGRSAGLPDLCWSDLSNLSRNSGSVSDRPTIPPG